MDLPHPVVRDVLCPAGHTPYDDAPGVQWASPWRTWNRPPIDAEQHERVTRQATAWLRASPHAWLEFVCAAHGVAMFTDGRQVSVFVPGIGPPARMTQILLGFVSEPEPERLGQPQ